MSEHRFGGYHQHPDLPQRQICCICSWASVWGLPVADMDAALEAHLAENDTASSSPNVLDDLAMELAKAMGRYRHDVAWSDQSSLSPAQQIDCAVDRAKQVRAVRYALRNGSVVRTLENMLAPGAIRGVRTQE